MKMFREHKKLIIIVLVAVIAAIVVLVVCLRNCSKLEADSLNIVESEAYNNEMGPGMSGSVVAPGMGGNESEPEVNDFSDNDFDNDWEKINCTFTNYKFVGYEGNKFVYKSDSCNVENTWSTASESHTFGNYAAAVSGDSVNFFFTRQSGDYSDKELVMKINFSLYKESRPYKKYTFMIKHIDSSDDGGKEDNIGYAYAVRNYLGGGLVPEDRQTSTLDGIKYLYPDFDLGYNSLAEALNSGDWCLSLDEMHIYER